MNNPKDGINKEKFKILEQVINKNNRFTPKIAKQSLNIRMN